MPRESFEIGPVRVRAGRRQSLALPITRLVTGADVDLPVRVVHGREEGPTIWLDAAIHGDEAVGVEVVRQVLAGLDPKTLRGTIVAVPIVNVLGFMTGSRYLPDRRDLNRSFPGSPRGSLAGRIAHLFMTEVVQRCTVGIDLHTGSDRRTNLPQIRADLEDPGTRALAEAFAAPAMLHARLRDGSLRYAARERGAKVLLYEAGEAWRMDPWAVQAGVVGVQRVLAALGMTDPVEEEPPPPSAVSWRSGWVRARGTGMLHLEATLGQRVEKGERLGGLFDSFGKRVRLVHADRAGIVVGRTEAPLVSSGDAVVHIAEVEDQPPA
ncbi:succinylglutamate desuccinylase/aspartoacylase family protein [Phycicoccus sp. BSK3Z-2]|uniref:Succinylglutamate desuccinylase/aspartoacylase family protein n=1 Tax=Phycicoccus avicenniae TaxID=2828860 RepID=A0A941I0P8_9MICO|nr:succinylglutamate desuccinylase/aspartoacylase family protein [Phycicoccus avicenniae]MBR7744337.1 succinylglutamate desuccinylase/aspartoacylase family protein [Phycicoccus avicenniae]